MESGKTTCIRRLLKRNIFQDNRQTVLICCEQGLEEYDEALLAQSNTKIYVVDSLESLGYDFFDDILYNDHPARILIEYNGTWPVESLLSVSLPYDCSLERILCCVDFSTFTLYSQNTGNLLTEQLVNCDAVAYNRYRALTGEQFETACRYIRRLNPQAVLFSDKELLLKRTLKRQFLHTEADHYKGMGKALLFLLPLIVLYLYFATLSETDIDGRQALIQSFNTVFISLLIQAFPFILVGTLISSILQICVPENRLIRLFGKRKWFGFALAVGLGVFFPVCDCAMAPIAARLVKKGVPLPYAITFLLAAPAVSPIVILSTYYAFPGQPIVIVWRIVLGIAIALSAGVALSFTRYAKTAPLQDTLPESACASGYLGDVGTTTAAGRVQAVLQHASLEFFNVGKFVVAGAFISSVVQTTVSKDVLSSVGGTPFLSLFVMLFAAFVMSVCSTSNAFIARTFSASIPLVSLLCYMIMGPLLDIKNLLMLSSGFKKTFLLKLVGMLVAAALIVFSIARLWI